MIIMCLAFGGTVFYSGGTILPMNFFFWLCLVTRETLVPWPGIESGPQQLKRWVLFIGLPGSSQFHMNLRISFSISAKKKGLWNFDRDCVESVDSLGLYNILTILSLSFREHRWCSICCGGTCLLREWNVFFNWQRCFVGFDVQVFHFTSWVFYFFRCYCKRDCFLSFLSDCSLLLSRNSAGFCVLIIYPVTLLNLLIRCSEFLVFSLGLFFIDTVMSSVNRVLLLSNLLPFISYLYLISLGLEISVLCSIALVEGVSLSWSWF